MRLKKQQLLDFQEALEWKISAEARWPDSWPPCFRKMQLFLDRELLGFREVRAGAGTLHTILETPEDQMLAVPASSVDCPLEPTLFTDMRMAERLDLLKWLWGAGVTWSRHRQPV